MTFQIKNWSQFQHYKSGRGAPPWIKLYRDLLNDPEWFDLPADAAKFLVSCWILAAETDGFLPASKTIAFRLRLDIKQVEKFLSLCEHWIISDDSKLLAKRYQVAIPETETETEKETDINSPKQVRTTYSKDFELFWNGYPKDSNMSKKEAYMAWKRISDEDRKKATDAVPHFSAYCKANPDYRPIHAVRFITKARWEGFLQSLEKPRAGNRWGKAPDEMNPQELAEFLADLREKQQNERNEKHEGRTNLQ